MAKQETLQLVTVHQDASIDVSKLKIVRRVLLQFTEMLIFGDFRRFSLARQHFRINMCASHEISSVLV